MAHALNDCILLQAAAGSCGVCSSLRPRETASSGGAGAERGGVRVEKTSHTFA